jgi:hypothetical protein
MQFLLIVAGLLLWWGIAIPAAGMGAVIFGLVAAMATNGNVGAILAWCLIGLCAGSVFQAVETHFKEKKIAKGKAAQKILDEAAYEERQREQALAAEERRKPQWQRRREAEAANKARLEVENAQAMNITVDELRARMAKLDADRKAAAHQQAAAAAYQAAQRNHGFVYILRGKDGLVKIGKTKNQWGVRKRAENFGLPVIAYGETHNHHETELALHRHFARSRVGTYELFTVDEATAVAVLRQHCSNVVLR